MGNNPEIIHFKNWTWSWSWTWKAYWTRSLISRKFSNEQFYNNVSQVIWYWRYLTF